MQRRSRYSGAFSGFAIPSIGRSQFNGITVVTLSASVGLLLPPLFIASLPRRAIGFSYPRGREGQIISASLLLVTVAMSFSLARTLGMIAFPIMFWMTGGTALLMLFNCLTNGVAFVKQLCSSCRLRPVIEEHEAMHLNGEASEDAVWGAAKRKYSFENLRLGSDPKICNFCPIAKRLQDH